jgi:CRISPR/Cas system-associated protein Cas5 (RAMP superfamily)
MQQVPDTVARPETGTLPVLLGAIADHIPVTAIDEVWIFPPHRVGRAESVVAVVSAFEDGADRRRIFTARCTVVREPKGPGTVQREVAEEGSAPAERLGRLIEGVLRRLGDELPTAPPRQVRVGGDAARWEAVLGELESGAAVSG